MTRVRAVPWGALAVVGAIVAALGGVLAAPTHTLVGEAYVDGYGTQWFYDLAERVARGEADAARTDLLFHPWGKEVWLHTGGNLVDAWAALPLRAALGTVAGYNVWVALLLAGNALGGGALAWAVGVPAGRRWPAALAMVLNPFVLLELQLGRPTQAMLLPAALALALLLRMRTFAQAAGAGLLVALAGYAYWFHGFALGACVAVGALVRVGVAPRARDAGLLLVAGAVAALAVAPGVLPMLRAVEDGAVPGLLAMDGDGLLAPLALRTVEGDPEGVWIWSPLRMEAGSLVDDGGLRWLPTVAPVGATTLAGLLLAGGLALRARTAPAPREESPETSASGGVAGGHPRPMNPRVTFFAAAGFVGVAALLACGPALVAGDVRIANRPYLWLLEELPFLRRWWWPGRAAAMVHLVGAPALAWACAALAPRRAGWLGAAVGGCLTVEAARAGVFPLARWDARGSPVVDCVREGPPGAVLNVPWTQDQADLWLQVLHRRPILGGMLVKKPAFAPPQVAELRGRNVLLRVLDGVGEGRWRESLDVPDAARRELIALGYGTILARADAFRRPAPADLRGGAREAWVSDWSRPRRLLEKALGAPFAEDARFAAWTVDGAPRACAGAVPVVGRAIVP